MQQQAQAIANSRYRARTPKREWDPKARARAVQAEQDARDQEAQAERDEEIHFFAHSDGRQEYYDKGTRQRQRSDRNAAGFSGTTNQQVTNPQSYAANKFLRESGIEGAGVTLGRAVLPSGAGVVGSSIGAELGLLGGPLAPVTVPLGAIAGGYIGGALANRAQDEALRRTGNLAGMDAVESDFAGKHPWLHFGLTQAPSLLFEHSVSPRGVASYGQAVVKQAATQGVKQAAKTVGASAARGAVTFGVGAGLDLGVQKLSGQPIDLGRAAGSGLSALLLKGDKRTAVGGTLHDFGSVVGRGARVPLALGGRSAWNGARWLYDNYEPDQSRLYSLAGGVPIRRRPVAGPAFTSIEQLPKSVQNDVILPEYVKTEAEAKKIATGTSDEQKIIPTRNIQNFNERLKTIMAPPSQVVRDARQNFDVSRLDEQMLDGIIDTVENDRGVNFLGYDRQFVGTEPATGLFTTGGTGWHGENGVPNHVSTSNRIGAGEDTVERATTGSGNLNPDYFHPKDQPRLVSRAKGEFNLIGIGAPEMQRGNVQAPALYVSAMLAHALKNGTADVQTLQQALAHAGNVANEASIVTALKREVTKVEPKQYRKIVGKEAKTKFAQDYAEADPEFRVAALNRSASDGLVIDPAGRGDVRDVLKNLPFGSFETRNTFVTAVDDYLWHNNAGFPLLDNFIERQSAYPRRQFGKEAGSIVASSYNDLNNPTAVPAVKIDTPATGYEIHFPGATNGRMTQGRFLDFTGNKNDLPGSLPFQTVIGRLRMGALDESGNLVLGKRFDELPTDKQDWRRITKTGPWFVAPEDKAEVLGLLREMLRRAKDEKTTVRF